MCCPFGPDYEDQTVRCLDCGVDFCFTARDQAFYDEKKFADKPKRCKTCRDIRKAQRNPASQDEVSDFGQSYSGRQR